MDSIKYLEEVEIIISYECIYFYFFDLIVFPLSILFLLCKTGKPDFNQP